MRYLCVAFATMQLPLAITKVFQHTHMLLTYLYIHICEYSEPQCLQMCARELL